MEYKILINRWQTKKVGFNFDLFAWFKVCEMNKVEVHQIGKIPQEKMFADFIYCAYVSYNSDIRLGWGGIKLIKPIVTPEKLGAWVDKMNKGQSEKLAAQILAAKLFGKSIGEYKDANIKKKK